VRGDTSVCDPHPTLSLEGSGGKFGCSSAALCSRLLFILSSLSSYSCKFFEILFFIFNSVYVFVFICVYLC
jgi:hypothetical protein